VPAPHVKRSAPLGPVSALFGAPDTKDRQAERATPRVLIPDADYLHSLEQLDDKDALFTPHFPDKQVCAGEGGKQPTAVGGNVWTMGVVRRAIETTQAAS